MFLFEIHLKGKKKMYCKINTYSVYDFKVWF